ncbi:MULTISPECIES: arabinan endo-1,5-alpha-L-arabinosidase [Streptomyces]|uniref:Arabinan endo-1,5-alpha-L-arabinosidase n=1 Tax=Streptomyces lycii TaxID=2654337 RepID=A0ABQ7FQU7_9ACTN|nr:arabinan endo-1,5-alpha-L-arabinosidase [Streptomyces lycii]KAF4410825.1 arabinan endo-1,5-alpha-L-arabinosidase [Streptomyces lycii]
MSRSTRTGPGTGPRHRLRRRAALPALPAALLLALAPPSSASAAYPDPGRVTGDVVVHDPSMVRTEDGRYVLYSTHGGLEARVSTDRTHFTRAGSAFTDLPDWWSDYSAERDPWAPDISYHKGVYWMYYAVSSFGSNHSAIGLAKSPTGLPGSWSDRGIVYRTGTGDDHNAIDPSLFVDRDGTWWLSFGSYWTGIKMVRLDPATGSLHRDRTVHSLATRPDEPYAVEAPQIVKRGNYYYLFVSHDRCCAGTDSTYKIKVGRSTSPTGPYTDRDGVPMPDGGGTTVLATHGRFIGPGGQSVLKDSDGHVLVHHYYDGADDGTPKLGINLLSWGGGWPTAR